MHVQVYGLPVPDWAADAQRVVEVAAGVEVQPFVPKENVKIETGGCGARLVWGEVGGE